MGVTEIYKSWISSKEEVYTPMRAAVPDDRTQGVIKRVELVCIKCIQRMRTREIGIEKRDENVKKEGWRR